MIDFGSVKFEYNFLLIFLIDLSFIKSSSSSLTIFRVEFQTFEKKLDRVQVKLEIQAF